MEFETFRSKIVRRNNRDRVTLDTLILAALTIAVPKLTINNSMEEATHQFGYLPLFGVFIEAIKITRVPLESFSCLAWPLVDLTYDCSSYRMLCAN